MAPLPQALSTVSHQIRDAFADVEVSGLEHDLYRRDSIPTFPMDVNLLSKRLTTPPNPTYTPGAGAQPYYKFNNKGYFALFALLGAAMVIASIWFFFWARNGGFQFRRGDWEDYKSTVLRRKGPDGKTLSNATKSTKLGGGSVVAGMGGKKKNKNKKQTDKYTDKSSKWSDEMTEMEAGRSHKHSTKSKRPKDPELAAYRAEKPARIGGLNRQADGSHFDYSNTDRSEAMTDIDAWDTDPVPRSSKKDDPKAAKAKKEADKAEKEAAKRRAKLRMAAAKNAARVEARMKKTQEKNQKEAMKRQAKNNKDAAKDAPRKPEPAMRPPPSVATTEEDGSTVWTGPSTTGSGSGSGSGSGQTGDSYYQSYRPHTTAAQPSPLRNERSSYAGHRSSRQYPRSRYLDDLDEVTEASSETGTKVYEHHIPGLNRPAAKKPGYRRGGGTRRDSLSDSDGETRTTRS